MCNIRVLMPFVQGRYSNRNKGVTVPEDAHREEIIDALAGVMGDPHFAKAAKEHFYVRCNGRVIEGDTTLRDVGGREGSSVTCTLSLRGGGNPCVGKRGPTATDSERQEPDSKRACRDILATLGEEHIEDFDAGSADDVAGCEPDHADADPVCDADHADADDGCVADHADADDGSQPVDAHAATTAVKRSLRTCRLNPKVPCDADSEREDSTPKTVCEKVCRLTAHGSPRTQPCTNGF